LKKIIASIQEVPFLGAFEQVSHEVESGGGVRDEDNANSVLFVEKGRVVWKQDYQGNAMKQSYTFDDTRSSFKGETEIKLKFVKMTNGGAGYSPESNNPRLILKNTAHGVLVTFMATDGYGQTSTVQFAPSNSDKKLDSTDDSKEEIKKEDKKDEDTMETEVDED